MAPCGLAVGDWAHGVSACRARSGSPLKTSSGVHHSLMTEGTLDLQSAAAMVGVSPSTLRNWSSRLPLPTTDGPEGDRRYPPEALEVLEAVKHLRADDRSYDTIRRVIAPAPESVRQGTGPMGTGPLGSGEEALRRRVAELEDALRVLGQDRDRLARALAQQMMAENEERHAPKRSWWKGLGS